MNGADSLCETLLANDVDVCFANPGTSEMHFVAALDRQPRMRCILGVFEGVVTGAADGYARMAGKPAVTLLHTGPGLANGLANLHNARRAFSPMVNVVGDHASHHLAHDAPLTSDIDSLARPMSQWLRRAASPDTVGRDTAAAIQAARTNKVATLILPADSAWGELGSGTVPAVPARASAAQVPDARAMARAVQALRAPRRTALLLGTGALTEGGLAAAGRIAQATGVRLLAQTSNPRMARGVGRIPVSRIPYPVDMALAALREFEQLILVGAKAPVSFFGYPGKPSEMTPPGCEIVELAESGGNALEQTLLELADALGVGRDAKDGAIVTRAERAQPAAGKLTVEAVNAITARLLPENAIVCDESVTSGASFYAMTHDAPAHDYLQLTGGAIGVGLPMATGAAVACPDRKVVSLQADGSGLYTVQALWTQAREALDIVTIVYSNRSYAILRGEMAQVGAAEPGENAQRLLSLDDPAVDWVSVARGFGVQAERVDTTERFADVLKSALAGKGPFLIEALV
ncbi:acetolactate synthase large subunit [Verticiella sediminum]|uniref:Acetolactate synthase large subunit n=1 Tax=Verticiella sediminum TaxID=1247510 RepID=A0A556AJ02_9BURK|nr:acetolactate synthase large subunit [Verticiella sediminum]TSH92863.1 acetolactate synthase large subunit [Verticiella sediminum]